MKLLKGQLLRRYKRFLADIVLPSGEEITLHCPNTGSMRNCVSEYSPCWFSVSANPARKYANTLEIVTTPDGDLACINTARANGLVARAIDEGVIEELQGYRVRLAEQKYGAEKSRIDWLLTEHSTDPRNCYVEVKNLTLLEDGIGQFPDAVSDRGSKHLRELIAMRHAGARAVLVFCVNHSGINNVSPADAIDPVYGKWLREAADAGVEILAYKASFPTNIDGDIVDLALTHSLPVQL